MKIAIVGLGLIGGSIGLALKKANKKNEVIGIPHQEKTINQAIARQAIDWATTDLKKGVAEADIIFICTPLSLILQKIKEIAPALKKGAIVTDVGSSKAEIVLNAEKLMPAGTYFIGGHPMAGKERVKLEAAEADLFKNKTYILAVTKKTNKQALSKLETILKLLNCKIAKIDANLHDQVVAGISHMPLAVAAALVNSVADTIKGNREMKECAASGFRDTTRIASGDPELGIDMFTTNKDSVLRMLSAFKKSLVKIEKAIKAGNIRVIGAELAKAKEFRDSIYS